MNQRVTARIIGGTRFTTAEYQEYVQAARALNGAANGLNASRRAFASTGGELRAHPYIAPLLSVLSGSGTRCTASDHVELPYRRLITQCEAHAATLQSMASRLVELSALIIRTQSLYAQSDGGNKRSLELLKKMIFTASPLTALGALSISALTGIGIGYAKEGKINAFYAVESTSWMHESFVASIGAHAGQLTIPKHSKDTTSVIELIISAIIPGRKMGPALANSLTDTKTVNHGLEGIDRLLIPIFDRTHGDNLTVTRVHPKTDVVKGGKSTQSAIADQRRLSEGPLNGERGSGLEYGTIACCKYQKSDGTYAWRIIIPGTDGNHDSPMDWYTNFELMSSDGRQRETAESLRFLDKAMEQAGISPDDPVELVGHSQGGIVAAAAACGFKDKYNIQHIATLGSPIANFDIPEKTRVTAIEMDNEGIAALDGAANPDSEHWLTIRCSVQEDTGSPGPFPGTEVEDSSGDKNSTHYPKYHESGYRYAYGTGNKAVIEHDKHFRQVVDGDLQEVQYYQGRIGK